MTSEEILKKLQTLGTEKIRQNLISLGSGDNVFGVSPNNFNKQKEKIGQNQSLAAELWYSGNIDAQFLACMIAEPSTFSEQMIDDWTKAMSFYQITDLFVSSIVIPAGFAKQKMLKWIKEKNDTLRRCAYLLLTHLAKHDVSIENYDYLNYIYQIEKEIHTSGDRVKEAMNLALISMGERNKLLNMEALIIGMRIGQMTIDHGGKEMKLPYAFTILGNKKLKQQLPG